MNTRQLLFSFVLFSTVVSAGPAFCGEAVKRNNLDLTAALAFSDSGDTIDGGVGFSMPIAEYWGAEFTASAGTFRGDGSALDSVSGNLGVLGFVGDKDIGRVGLRYSLENSEFDSDDDFTLETESLTLLSELYLGQFTLGYTRADAETEVEDNSVVLSNPDGDFSTLYASYYALNDLRFGITDHGLDADGSTHMDAEYQVGRRTSLQLLYLDGDDTEVILAGVTFYFGGGSSLIENDRHY